MRRPVELRKDFDAVELRRLAGSSRDPAQVRRLLALAFACDGCSREDAARFAGMDRQTLRDWVHRFNAEGSDGLLDRKGPGGRAKLGAEHDAALAEWIAEGPDAEKDGVVRWRCCDLKRKLSERFGVDLSRTRLGARLHKLGYSWISARPQHPRQKPEAIETYKKRLAGPDRQAAR
jgi:transposase